MNAGNHPSVKPPSASQSGDDLSPQIGNDAPAENDWTIHIRVDERWVTCSCGWSSGQLLLTEDAVEVWRLHNAQQHHPGRVDS